MLPAFAALKLRPEILKACQKQGFKAPTPIQSIVAPVIAEGRDVVVEAKTGSGKTLSYGFPILNREPLQTQFPETLILAPTRELAEQIEAELNRTAGTLARPVVLLTGGGGMDKQRARLTEGASIVVGTIGRIEELLDRRFLRLDHVRTVVLDEVDELLKGGFSGNLATLFGKLPRDRQTAILSATIPTEVETVARKFTKSAARLRTSVERELPAELTHRVLFTPVADRIGNLVGYLEGEKPYQTLIFCGTRHETEEVKQALDELGLDAEFLHGELSPLKRRQILEHFRSGDLPVLVASDLAARGLDLPGVDLIVNYSLPAGTAAYLHRAGRTGRAGRPGVVLSLVIGQQHEQWEKLKPTFDFEHMEVSSRGKVFSHPVRTREERDLIFRELPPKPPPGERRPPPPPPEEPKKPAKKGFSDRKSEDKPRDGKKFEGKKFEGKPRAGKKFDGKPREGRKFEGKPREEKKFDGKQRVNKPREERPPRRGR